MSAAATTRVPRGGVRPTARAPLARDAASGAALPPPAGAARPVRITDAVERSRA